MVETGDWQGNLAVTGVGLVTPVGLTAPATAAALRGAISRLSLSEYLYIPRGEDDYDPVTCAQIPELCEGLMGMRRLRAMLRPALMEALQQAGVSADAKVGFYLGTSGAHAAERFLDYDPAYRALVKDAWPGEIADDSVHLIPGGRTACLSALRQAAHALETQDIEYAVVGSVDSWVTPRPLHWLLEEGLLPASPRKTGMIPGEAAGCLVIESLAVAQRRDAQVLARVTRSSGRLDQTPKGEPMMGNALAEALRAAGQGLHDQDPVMYSDLNGDRYRVLEWAGAEVKGMWPYQNMVTEHCADCVGDSGAAMGAINLAWATQTLHRDHIDHQRIFIWGSAMEGGREVAVVERV